MSTISRIMTPIAAPYNLIRRGIFSLIYPAWYIYAPTAAEIEEKAKEPINEPLGDYTWKFNLRKELADDKSNQFKMDLDGCMIYKYQTQPYDPSKQYVIHCDGNATCYEGMLNTLERWCNSNRNIVLFNPPGVKFSPGYCRGPEDYITSLKCMIEHLHARGIPYENITLSGRSLGAAISTMVANDYHKQQHRVKLFSDRSFASMADEAAMFVKNSIPTTILRATIGNALYYVVNGFVRMFGINFSPVSAFSDINTIHPGDARCIAVKNDRIVPFAQSLYAGLSEEMRSKYAGMYEVDITTDEDPHNLPLSMLNSTNSELSGEKYFLNTLNIFAPGSQTEKQAAAQTHELLIEIMAIVKAISDLQELTNTVMTKKQQKEMLKMIGAWQVKIESEITQLLEIGKQFNLVQNPKIQQLQLKLDEILSIATKVQQYLQVMVQITENASIQNSSMFFRTKPSSTILPEEPRIKAVLEEINEQLVRFTNKFP